MRIGGGKQKGSAFEREICKDLSLWISGGERDDLFWRSAMSGGRQTVGYKKVINRKNQGGDITSIDPIGNKLTDKYVIECKSYKNIHLQSMLYGIPKNASIYEFWIELYNKSKQLNKDMMLVIKYNTSVKLLGLTKTSRTIGNLQKTLHEDYDIKPLAIFSNILPECYLYEFKYILNIVDTAVLEI